MASLDLQQLQQLAAAACPKWTWHAALLSAAGVSRKLRRTGDDETVIEKNKSNEDEKELGAAR